MKLENKEIKIRLKLHKTHNIQQIGQDKRNLMLHINYVFYKSLNIKKYIYRNLETCRLIGIQIKVEIILSHVKTTTTELNA